MLNVKLLDSGAIAPTVANEGDLGYDLYALEDVRLGSSPMWVRTGISVEDTDGNGFIIKDRSSMAAKGIFTHGGVIDAGYRGEIKINMTVAQSAHSGSWVTATIRAGEKIAQMVPVKPLTTSIVVVEELGNSKRGVKGFGSSGM